MRVKNEETTPTERFESLAGQFRGLMTDGMSFEGHNEYRTSFYERVTSTANKVCNILFPCCYDVSSKNGHQAV